jgi:hypothetical protein
VLKWAYMATLDNEDLKAIKNLMEITIDETLGEKLVAKEIFGQLLTKDDFFKKIDDVMVKLKGI